jgi:hypothetical protein
MKAFGIGLFCNNLTQHIHFGHTAAQNAPFQYRRQRRCDRCGGRPRIFVPIAITTTMAGPANTTYDGRNNANQNKAAYNSCHLSFVGQLFAAIVVVGGDSCRRNLVDLHRLRGGCGWSLSSLFRLVFLFES